MKERSLNFRQDVRRFVAPAEAPKGIRLFLKTMLEPGLQFAWMARLQMSLEQGGSSRRARIVHLVNLRATGAEFGHGCTVGGGLVAKHPLGLVVGGGTVIGRNCTILHNVTFGERYPDSVENHSLKYPRVGDDCLIGTSAVILGAVRLGDGCKVGAGAVVLHDVPENTSVVGSPARPLHR